MDTIEPFAPIAIPTFSSTNVDALLIPSPTLCPPNVALQYILACLLGVIEHELQFLQPAHHYPGSLVN